MPRFFNTAGPCRPEDHYMLPPERRLAGIRRLLEEKAYCVVHAPRQSGKTTSFQALAKTPRRVVQATEPATPITPRTMSRRPRRP